MTPCTRAPRILIVDDDPAIGALARASLEQFGYSTCGAGSGEEAIRVFKARQADVELVVTDVVMPGMDGFELASRLRQVKPELALIVMSGSGNPQGDGTVPFLAKPFGLETLLHLVHEVLGAPKGIGREAA